MEIKYPLEMFRGGYSEKISLTNLLYQHKVRHPVGQIYNEESQ